MAKLKQEQQSIDKHGIVVICIDGEKVKVDGTNRSSKVSKVWRETQKVDETNRSSKVFKGISSHKIVVVCIYLFFVCHKSHSDELS